MLYSHCFAITNILVVSIGVFENKTELIYFFSIVNDFSSEYASDCKIYSLCLEMIVLPPEFFCLKRIVWDQMFIDFDDVEIFAKQFGVANNFYIK